MCDGEGVGGRKGITITNMDEVKGRSVLQNQPMLPTYLFTTPSLLSRLFLHRGRFSLPFSHQEKGEGGGVATGEIRQDHEQQMRSGVGDLLWVPWWNCFWIRRYMSPFSSCWPASFPNPSLGQPAVRCTDGKGVASPPIFASVQPSGY